MKYQMLVYNVQSKKDKYDITIYKNKENKKAEDAVRETEGKEEIPTADGFDISELVHGIEYTTSLLAQPGKLSFTLEKDGAGILEIDLGSAVHFSVVDDDGKKRNVFFGYVFSMGTDKTEAYRVVAYDQMFYLRNHDIWAVSEGTKSLKEFFEEICTACKFKHEVRGRASTDDTKLPNRVFMDESYFEMLSWAMETRNLELTKEENFESKDKTYKIKKGDTLNQIAKNFNTTADKLAELNGIEDKNDIKEDAVIYITKAADPGMAQKTPNGYLSYFRYFIKDEMGTLVLTDIETEYNRAFNDGEVVEIGDGSLLTDYQYETDIEKATYNEIFAISPESGKDEKGNSTRGMTFLMAGQSETVQKWGKLRKILNLKEGAASQMNLVESLIKFSLETEANPTRTLRLEALGHPGLDAGSGFNLNLSKLGAHYRMYVVSACHHYGADRHTMSLETSEPSGISMWGGKANG